MNISIPHSHGLHGTVTLPGDKSISHRAMMIASLADGTSEIQNYSAAADPQSTLRCFRDLGIEVEENNGVLRVQGKGLYGLQKSAQALDAGNSGTTMRLLSGILAGQKFASTILGDASLSRRPMKRIMEPLRLMGAHIEGTESQMAPLQIQASNGLRAISYSMPVASAQVKSSILFAGLFAEGTTSVIEAIPTRDHTERMLGLQTDTTNGSYVVTVQGGTTIAARNFVVPGDVSAAAFFIVAASVIPGSDLLIQNVGLNPSRRQIVDVMLSIGSSITFEHQRSEGGEDVADLRIRSSELRGDLTLSPEIVAGLIDELPILSIAALFTDGIFTLHHAQELRAKETDRIQAMVTNLCALGADVEEYEDGYAFTGNRPLHGASLSSYDDHRIAMAFGVAGLLIDGITIRDAGCVDISFPTFWQQLLH